jgi:hypothetical protein
LIYLFDINQQWCISLSCIQCRNGFGNPLLRQQRAKKIKSQRSLRGKGISNLVATGESIGDHDFPFGLLEEGDVQSHTIDRTRRPRHCRRRDDLVRSGAEIFPDSGRHRNISHRESDEEKRRQQGGGTHGVSRVGEDVQDIESPAPPNPRARRR